MEVTTLLTLFSLLFLSFTPKLGECSCSHGISPPPAVLDSFGNHVRKGEYYKLVAWPNKPLVFTLTSSIFPLVNRNGTCWVQHEIELFTIAQPSLPVEFSPIKPNEDEFIREFTYVDIKFDEVAASYVCGGSVWRVGDNPDQVFGQQFVNVGGHGEARTTWFKIVKDSKLPHNNYNILFCPGDSFGRCRNVGIFADGDRKGRLALADHSPVPFAFIPIHGPQSQYIEMKF